MKKEKYKPPKKWDGKDFDELLGMADRGERIVDVDYTKLDSDQQWELSERQIERREAPWSRGLGGRPGKLEIAIFTICVLVLAVLCMLSSL